jgi:hypothetical protein
VEDEGGMLVARRGGREDEIASPLRAPPWLSRASLNSRQHDGQRHSTKEEPSDFVVRVRRHPNCALMSVWLVSVSGHCLRQLTQV